MTAHAHIVEVWDSATPDQIAKGQAWYDVAHATARTFAERYGVTLEQAAGVIAATSPNNGWGSNRKLAERLLATREMTGYFTSGLDKVARILDGEDPEEVFRSKVYFKVANFYLSIVSKGRRGITVDRHAWDVYTGIRHADKHDGSDLPVRPSISGKRYRDAVAAFESAAQYLSAREGREISPTEVQAVTWVAWRRRFWNEGAFDGEDD